MLDFLLSVFGLGAIVMIIAVPIWRAVLKAAPDNQPAAPAKPAAPVFQDGPSAALPKGPVLGLDYVDLEGRATRRLVTITDVTLDEFSLTGLPHSIEAFCHEKMAARTFLLTGMRRAVFADGQTSTDQEVIGYRLLMDMGEQPQCTIPERRPGTHLSRRHPRPPIEVVLEWERSPGDLETFDMVIEDVELAGGTPFAFSGTARRRKSATDRAYRAEKRFKLRGWDTPGAPIRAMYTPDGVKLTRPHVWLAEMTGRR